MANARQILSEKSKQEVISVDPAASVLEAARMMNEHHIGSLVVLEGDRLQGIFTERDVMRRIVAEGKNPDTTPVRDVMTHPVACAAPHTAYTELCTVMREERIRHLPVVEDDKVLGMISIGDLNRADHDDQEKTIKYLEQFMSVT